MALFQHATRTNADENTRPRFFSKLLAETMVIVRVLIQVKGPFHDLVVCANDGTLSKLTVLVGHLFESNRNGRGLDLQCMVLAEPA